MKKRNLRGLVLLFTATFALLPWNSRADLNVLQTELASVQVTLPQAKLDPLLEQARGLDLSVYSTASDRLLSSWRATFAVDGDVAYPLKYTNPELVDIVHQVYIGAVERERAYTRSLQQPGPRYERRVRQR